MNNIVITGGAGFIGTNLYLKLKSLNKKVIVVDHIYPKNKKNLDILGSIEFIDKDKFLKLITQNKINNISHIIHLGARSDTTEKDWIFLKNNNVEYSKKLYNYCAEKNIPFIYASSAATYGDGRLGYDDRTRKLKPLNLYGKSKYIFDEWVLKQKKKPIQYVGLKFFNVFGPYEYHKGKMASVIFHGFKQIKKNGKIKLFKSYKKEYKDGGQMRDFVYVKDVVDVIVFFLKNPQLSGIFNVGTGRARTFSDLANSIFKALKIKENVEFIEMPNELKNKYQYFTEAKMDKLKKVGYKKRFKKLESAVFDYVNNYLLPSVKNL